MRTGSLPNATPVILVGIFEEMHNVLFGTPHLRTKVKANGISIFNHGDFNLRPSDPSPLHVIRGLYESYRYKLYFTS